MFTILKTNFLLLTLLYTNVFPRYSGEWKFFDFQEFCRDVIADRSHDKQNGGSLINCNGIVYRTIIALLLKCILSVCIKLFDIYFICGSSVIVLCLLLLKTSSDLF